MEIGNIIKIIKLGKTKLTFHILIKKLYIKKLKFATDEIFYQNLLLIINNLRN